MHNRVIFISVAVELQIPVGLSLISHIGAKNNQSGLLKHPVLDKDEHGLGPTLV